MLGSRNKPDYSDLSEDAASAAARSVSYRFPTLGETMGLRVAIVSTPRSGNTWLRSLLADAYELPEVAIHNPADVDWNTLPPDCVLQIHWHRTASFVRTLQEAGFRILTLVRHPLDVLLSILQFCQHDRSTLRWLDGENGNERPLYGAMPGSAAFAAYATGGRAAALLSVSTQWWQAPDVCRLRYEALVADPAGQLGGVAEALGAVPRRPLAEVVGRATVPELRVRFKVDHHFWQGRPGLWKTLLTAAAADRIARAQRDAFACGYACDPDPQLTPEQADAAWVGLAGYQVADKLYHCTRTAQRLADAQEALRQSQHHARQIQAERDATCAALWTDLNAGRQELHELRQVHQELCARHQETAAELDHLRQLGPLPLAVAWKLRNLSHRYPSLSAAARSTLRRVASWTRFGRRARVAAGPAVTPPAPGGLAPPAAAA
jgi:hypothetical protein